MSERDEVLVRHSRGGDHRAFAELVERYERPVFALAHRMTGSRDVAEELTQIVFVKAWRGLGGFDDRRRFFSWIYRIAIHECLNHRRTVGRFESMEVEPASPDGGPVEESERHDTEARVQRALEGLSPGDREVVVLRHFLDLSYEEIAEALRIPAKTVKSRLFSARQRLRVELERCGAHST